VYFCICVVDIKTYQKSIKVLLGKFVPGFAAIYRTIRPRLEYAVQAWRPYLQKVIDLIEGVQRRATKLVVETKGMSYDERLKFLDMTTLETRRVRGI
jgi:hypothetical protein